MSWPVKKLLILYIRSDRNLATAKSTLIQRIKNENNLETMVPKMEECYVKTFSN